MALLPPLPLGKMSPRYLELNRLLDFLGAPGALAGICKMKNNSRKLLYLLLHTHI